MSKFDQNYSFIFIYFKVYFIIFYRLKNVLLFLINMAYLPSCFFILANIFYLLTSSPETLYCGDIREKCIKLMWFAELNVNRLLLLKTKYLLDFLFEEKQKIYLQCLNTHLHYALMTQLLNEDFVWTLFFAHLQL